MHGGSFIMIVNDISPVTLLEIKDLSIKVTMGKTLTPHNPLWKSDHAAIAWMNKKDI